MANPPLISFLVCSGVAYFWGLKVGTRCECCIRGPCSLLPPCGTDRPPSSRWRGGGGAWHSANFGRKCLEFRFRFREGTQIFPFLVNLLSTSTQTEARWILIALRQWLLRPRSPRPHRNPRRPSPRPPERKMTRSWANLVELWPGGKRLKKVNS